MPIDPRMVKWDDKPKIDPRMVKWDAPAESEQPETAMHGLGRGTRAALDGIAGIGDFIGSPAFGAARAAGLHPVTFGGLATSASDAMGLPNPANASQRIQSDMERAGTGTAVTLGTGAALGPANALGRFMSANPVQQAIASQTGSLAGGLTRENGGGQGAQLTASLLAGLTPSAISTAAPAAMRGLLRGGEQGRQGLLNTINDFATAGATPTVGQGTQGWVQSVESILAKMPGSAGKMARTAQQQGQDIGAGVSRLADTLAPGADATSAGQAIRQGVVGPGGFQQKQAATASRLYGNLDASIPANMGVPVPHTTAALGSVNPDIPGAPNLSPLFKNSRISSIADMFAKDAAPTAGGLPGITGPQLPYQAVQKLRTAVGKEVGNANFASDVPVGDWKQIYGGLSQDMKGAANAAGPEAQQAFSRANNHYLFSQNRAEAIAHVVNKEVPEDVFNAAMRGTKDGATTLRKVMQSIPEEGQKEVASAVLRRMGRAINSQQDATGEAFSTQTFLTNWNKLGEPARNALFDRFGPQFRDQVDAITRVSSNLRDGSKVFANPSGTSAAAAHMGGYAALGTAAGGALLGHPVPLLAVAGSMGANRAAAGLLTNPDFVRMLARKTPTYAGSLLSMPAMLQSL